MTSDLVATRTRLTTRFDELKKKNEGALVCYVVAGDPSLQATVEIVKTLDRADADVVELGIPFSDPLADGPTIQLGSLRALSAGASVISVLETLRQIRKVSEIPVVLMTYFNPAMQYGVERFAQDAAAAGADGVIQTDLTPEESDYWVGCAQANNLDTVFLAAPTSTTERLTIAAERCSGFFYAVSRTGVTGAQQSVSTELPEMIARIRAVTDLPVCVGFGVSKPEHVTEICHYADGAVVGSSLVDLIGKFGSDPQLQDKVFEYVASLKSATRNR
ncbi:MAG: tryptophan synthase subunit alpha [Chthonomonadales bacterium]